MRRGMWVKANRNLREERAEAAEQLGGLLAEMSRVFPDADESGVSSASYQQSGVEFDRDLWDSRQVMLADLYKELKDKRKSKDDFCFYEAKRILGISEFGIPMACLAIQGEVFDTLRPRYLAVDEVDLARGVWRRIYSSDPDKLPLAEDRPLPSGIWADNVINNRAPCVAKNLNNAAEELPDFDLFRSLGCLSFGYLPVSHGPGSNLLGVLTVLGKENFFTPKKLERLVESRTAAWLYLSFAHTGLHLKNPDHKPTGGELVPVETEESAPVGGALSMIREKAPTLLRDTMERARYESQMAEMEEGYRALQRNPMGMSKSELEKMRQWIAVLRGDMDEACRMLERTANKRIKSRYFAVEEVDLENGLYRRIHSSKPDELPVTGMRPIPDGGWAATVLLHRTLASSNDMRECPDFCPDHDMVCSLGCQSCVYLPVCKSEEFELYGVLSFFDEEGYFHRKVINRILKMRDEAVTCLGTISVVRNSGLVDVSGRA